LLRAKPYIEETAKSLGAKHTLYDEKIAKVSIIGLGMRSHAGIAAKMLRLPADEKILFTAISTSEIKVSCLIHRKYTGLAARVLHDGLSLAAKTETQCRLGRSS